MSYGAYFMPGVAAPAPVSLGEMPAPSALGAGLIGACFGALFAVAASPKWKWVGIGAAAGGAVAYLAAAHGVPAGSSGGGT